MNPILSWGRSKSCPYNNNDDDDDDNNILYGTKVAKHPLFISPSFLAFS